jgi:hypothetical protein
MTEVNLVLATLDSGGPIPSPQVGKVPCFVIWRRLVAQSAVVPAIGRQGFRFAAAGIRAVRRGIQPLFGVIILVGF